MLNRCLLLTVVVMMLSACASGPGRSRNITNESFFTDIKDNDAKLFVYIANFKSAPIIQTRPAPGSNAAPVSRQGMSNLRSEVALKQEEEAIEALEYKLLTSGYCRQGYFILGNYNQFGSVEIRGECQESATDTDRKLFQSIR